MKKPPRWPGIALRGMAMGIAEVIPGVSGGTIAFITGIYEELLQSIKSVDHRLVGEFRRGGVRAVWSAMNGDFLLALLVGMGAGLVAGIFGVTYVLKNYPPLIWAFFFGLIIASSIYIFRQIERWRWQEVVAILLGTAVAYYVTIAHPGQGSEAWWFIFLSGVLAISALILPGISGSFILLLLGMYTVIIPTVKHALETLDSHSLLVILVFGLGCLTGLAAFARLLSWTFKNFRSLTLATLTGFMLGSLNKLWPWRNVLEWRENTRGELVPLVEANVLPGAYEGEPLLTGTLLCFLLGFGLVFFIEWMGKRWSAH